jgi:hypothetical protein
MQLRLADECHSANTQWPSFDPTGASTFRRFHNPSHGDRDQLAAGRNL